MGKHWPSSCEEVGTVSLTGLEVLPSFIAETSQAGQLETTLVLGLICISGFPKTVALVKISSPGHNSMTPRLTDRKAPPRCQD